MKDEQKFISEVTNAKSRTFIDMGAGNGRVESFLSKISKNVIAIEINREMYAGLKARSADLKDVTAIEGDFFDLAGLLPSGTSRPVFLFLQNTLGTIEGGTAKQALAVAIDEAKQKNGGVILSVFRQFALKSWGLNMYGKITDMLGRQSPDKTVVEKGVFVTDTGYTSKWWTDEDIAGFRTLGKVVREQSTDEYTFLELAFDQT